MKKNNYIAPRLEVIKIIATQKFLAGSGGGPSANSQHNPGMGSSSAPDFDDPDWDE